MKFLVPALAALAIASPVLAAESAPPAPPADAKAEPAKPLTIESKIGALIDNKQTDAVLKKVIPEIRASESFFKDSRDKTIAELVGIIDGIDHGKLTELEQGIEEAQKAPPAPRPAQ